MSTLKVNLIEPLSGGTVTITGASIASASFATSASFAQTAAVATVANGLSDGNKTLNNGALTQNFTAPALNNEVQLINVSGANIGGRAYNRVASSFSNFAGSGLSFEDFFGIEYYDSFGYNFGSEFGINGKQVRFLLAPSGSGFSQLGAVDVTDNYDGTSTAQVLGTTVNIGNGNQTTTVNIGGANTANINVSGSVNFKDTLNLAPQDPLPGNGLGKLAVSGSNLFFNDGATWTQIN